MTGRPGRMQRLRPCAPSWALRGCCSGLFKTTCARLWTVRHGPRLITASLPQLPVAFAVLHAMGPDSSQPHSHNSQSPSLSFRGAAWRQQDLLL